ncbi:polysaccharide export outer membrane protein [Cognatishimia maritima]|uniref:Polysaccharide export outer membrane protein n=2 Tax=Cognatishimia maritima TaxID=870908 RepID=A0A1M5WCV7_9RHOB|nr:polysaccharide export outer membrane protein [Cognatishimia maritima]
MAAAGCTLPRGAALEAEIVNASKDEVAAFAVEPVTRANLARLKSWPMTGWSGSYHWLEVQRGPLSNRLFPGDELTLTIWDSDQNSLLIGPGQKQTQVTRLEVSASGDVFVPYVGDIQVSGLSTTAARQAIQDKLGMVTQSAQVQLQLQQGPGNTVDIVSGVGRPGSYPLANRNASLLSVLAQAGGIDKGLRHPIVRLIRAGKTYEIPAEALLADASKNIILRGRDQIVVVKDDRSFIALGATGSERLVYFEQEEITALEALSIIGGLNDGRANPQGVLILREYPDSAVGGTGPSKAETIFTLDLTSADGLFAARNFLIHPDDTVLATESPVTSAQTVLGLMGRVLSINRALN